MVSPPMPIAMTQPQLAQGHEQSRPQLTNALEGNRHWVANDHGETRRRVPNGHLAVGSLGPGRTS